MMAQQILDLDLGNSRLKWRWSDGQSQLEGALANGDLEAELFLAGRPVQRVRVAAVAGDHLLEAVLGVCRQRWHLEPEIAVVQEQCAGVRQGYRDPARLGVDRWLGILAAYNRVKGACVVVSCGTALTVDLVTAAGEHRGGYIVPGLEMMRTALFSGTHAVKLPRLDMGGSLTPGRDTQEAVSRGLLLMAKGLVSCALDSAGALTEDSALILTGGDGERLLPLFLSASTKAQYLPNLVLDGLALALP